MALGENEPRSQNGQPYLTAANTNVNGLTRTPPLARHLSPSHPRFPVPSTQYAVNPMPSRMHELSASGNGSIMKPVAISHPDSQQQQQHHQWPSEATHLAEYGSTVWTTPSGQQPPGRGVDAAAHPWHTAYPVSQQIYQQQQLHPQHPPVSTPQHSSTSTLYPVLTPSAPPVSPRGRSPERFCWPGEALMGLQNTQGGGAAGMPPNLSYTTVPMQESQVDNHEKPPEPPPLSQDKPPPGMLNKPMFSNREVLRGPSKSSISVDAALPAAPSAQTRDDTSGGGDSPIMKASQPEQPPGKPGAKPTKAKPLIALSRRRPRRRDSRRALRQEQDLEQKCVLCNRDLGGFFVVTLLQFMVGAVTFAFGVNALFEKKRMDALSNMDFSGELESFNIAGLIRSGYIVLMVGGGSVLVLGFLGCFGVLTRSKPMVLSYGIIVLLVAVAQITAAAVALTNRDVTTQRLRQSLLGHMHSYIGHSNSTNLFSQALDLVQITYDCCGVDGPGDFADTPWWTERQNMPNKSRPLVPSTCCKLARKDSMEDTAHALHKNITGARDHLVLQDPMCPYKDFGPLNPNTDKSCFEVLINEVMKHIILVLTLAVMIVIVEISVMCSACRVVTLLERNDDIREMAEMRTRVRRWQDNVITGNRPIIWENDNTGRDTNRESSNTGRATSRENNIGRATNSNTGWENNTGRATNRENDTGRATNREENYNTGRATNLENRSSNTGRPTNKV